jgi:hypothetical protein
MEDIPASRKETPWYMDGTHKFINKIVKALENDKSQTTRLTYIRRLVILNDGNTFANFTFLKDTDKIKEKLASKAESTQLAYYTAINAGLGATPSYKKLLQTYTDIAKPLWDKFNGHRQSHEKTEKQKESIVPKNEIVVIRDGLEAEVNALQKVKTLSEPQYEKYLMYLLVSLYTYIPPRRNMDYAKMYVVKKEGDDATKNYLVLSKKQFVFNIYKTSGVYGKQVVDIPDELMAIINTFLKRHPNMKRIGTKLNPEAKMLVRLDNSPIHEINGITRLLNKAFGKKIGASALRHIYLSDKYGNEVEEKKKDAEAMAHSLAEQNEYIKV